MATAASSSVRPRRCCSPTKFLLLILLISAVPIAYIISLERSPPSTHVYYYHSSGYLRECAVWDASNRRFLVSFFDNGIGQITENGDGGVLEERVVVKDADLAGYASLGLAIDRPRNRALVAIADVLTNRYSALAAYDLSTWKRIFLTQLAAPGDEKSMADDVAVDPEGNAYVTDTKSSKIWKVGAGGELQSIIKNPLFAPKEWYKSLISLNGIVYHPDGYLLVIHTFSGNLFKIILNKEGDGEEVKSVKILSGSLMMGDGIELLSPTKLVVAAAHPSGRLVESIDGWETASVVSTFSGPVHRLATSATVKDGKVYLSHMFGLGYPKKKHALVEAVFTA
uniref:Uncharacterized protein n=1 Tax=Kalanchoe fedtschenkoi TaxID=63787 RepID=A0A7N0VIB4_KALFE